MIGVLRYFLPGGSPPRKKKALLIAISYSTSASVPPKLKLKNSHENIIALRNKLIGESK